MKFNKISKRFAAGMLTGIMMVSMMGMTVFAEGKDEVEATGNVLGTATFTKTLDMTNAVGATIPNVTFKYAIVPGAAVAATSSTQAIYAGVGVPTIADISYVVKANYTDTDLTKTVTVDFSDVKFEKPGIYRYIITENASTNNVDIKDDISYVDGNIVEGNRIRYLDVYVVYAKDTEGKIITDTNGGPTFKIEHSVLLKNVGEPDFAGKYPGYAEGADTSLQSKSNGFVNAFETHELTVTKRLEGAMANVKETFAFSVKITGDSGETYQAYITNAEGSKKTGSDMTLTSGTAVGNIMLGMDETLHVIGVSSTDQYEIIESNACVANGYFTTISGADTGNVTDKKNTANRTASGSFVVDQDDANADDAVVYTNIKDAITPTGVVMTIAPYILMVALAGVFAVLFLRRRRNEF